MSERNSNINRKSLSTFFQYLKGKMSNKDQNALERELLNDPFEADALDGFKEFSEETIKNDLSALKNRLGRNENKKIIKLDRKYIGIAATLIFIAGIISVLLLFTPQDHPMVSESKPAIETEEIKPKKSPKTETTIPVKEEENPIIQEQEALKNETSIDKEDKLVDTYDDLDIIDESEIAYSAPAKSKAANLKGYSIEPTNTLESSRKRGKQDSAATEIFGTLKGEPLIAGTTAYDSSFRTIEGMVKDKYQQPVPGAKVSIKGTSHGAISNADGTYQFKYPSRDSSLPLQASYVGYKPAEMVQNNAESVDFVLEEEYHTLSEVITIETSEEERKKAEEYISAEPEIGMDNYMDELLKDMNYPANGTGKKETVVAIIIISRLGHIKDVVIKRSPGEAYSMEMIRLIQEGPVWKPATKYGMTIQDEVKIKLRFIPR